MAIKSSATMMSRTIAVTSVVTWVRFAFATGAIPATIIDDC
jgi:hypothetical protein